jgi:hypothetical protein
MVIMTALFTQVKFGITAGHRELRLGVKKDTNMANVRNFLVVSEKYDECTVCV